MVNSFINTWAKKINIICLVAAISMVLVLPFKKEVWYDETVSMLISRGISHDTPGQLANTTSATSSEIALLNTSSNVFTATVLDNGNSFVYNIGLHLFTQLFGNSIAVYMLFSKLCAIAVLLAFFAFCRLLFRDSIFTSLAVIFLLTDITFIGMSHEIRAYAMGMFFVTIAAVYLYKFLYQADKPFYLFLIGLFSVLAVLSHFLSVYAVLVFLGYLVFTKKAGLFSMKNIMALLVPVAIVATYMYFVLPGLRAMSVQNATIAQKAAIQPFTIGHVIVGSLNMLVLDLKTVFPAFREKAIIIVLSFLVIIALYTFAIVSASNKTDKRNLHLLFILGASGSIFLALLAIKSHHYTSIYHRYHSFCLPFGSLFMAYVFYVLFSNAKVDKWVKTAALCILLLPSCALFFTMLRAHPAQKYNHFDIAREIVNEHITKIEVPEWADALLIQCCLPKNYVVNYVLNPASRYFTLSNAATTKTVPVIRDNS